VSNLSIELQSSGVTRGCLHTLPSHAGSNLQLAIREDAPDEEPVEPSLAGKAAVILSNLRKVYPPRRLGLIGRSLALLTSWWPFGRGRGGAYIRQRDSGKRSSKPTVAVKGLTLNLFEGQVFAFLGHTGSGKSSVVSMLMGLVRPTSGEAYVYSHRVTQAGEETCYLQMVNGVLMRHSGQFKVSKDAPSAVQAFLRMFLRCSSVLGTTF
jgi:ABC-type multidrug transport system fused ATPase/permease subunit